MTSDGPDWGGHDLGETLRVGPETRTRMFVIDTLQRYVGEVAQEQRWKGRML